MAWLESLFVILIALNCQIVFQRLHNWPSLLQLLCPVAIEHLSSSIFIYKTKLMHMNEWKATTQDNLMS